MKYYRSRYKADGSTAIICNTEYGTPYATVSICLVDYDRKPPTEKHIFIPKYKFTDGNYTMFKRDLVKAEVKTVQIGFGEGVLVELRDDWKEFCEPLE